MGYIYKIYNDINDKIYIGQTRGTISNRFHHHLNDKQNIDKSPLHQAIQKYGKHHFFIEKVEECNNSLLDDREIYWIDYYNSYLQGYNATKGGRTGYKYDYKEIAEKYVELQSVEKTADFFGCSKPIVIEAYKSQGINSLQTYDYQELCNFYLEHDFNSTLQHFNCSKPTLYKALKAHNLPLPYTIDKNKIIDLYQQGHSQTKIKELTGHDMATIKNIVEEAGIKRIKPLVYQYDLDGNFIQKYISCAEAERQTGIGSKNISAVCNHKRKTTGGYKWEYIIE